MVREKRTAPGVVTGGHAKERHKRARRGNLMDWTAPLPPGLVARPEKPSVSSKHKSWFEFVENKEKKKKLEFEFTNKKEPPPGFEFVPIGNPALTTACKELSREQDAMIFIVTSAYGFSKRLSSHLNRVGHHIRQSIVEQARAALGDDQLERIGAAPDLPEPIPERQEDINKQADGAIRDLFPRIPNTDRQMIIEHAFNKSRPIGKDGPPVGLAPDVTLSRRVQLAVLAHIRHNHTRYDQLLRETSYVNARKTVESLCLDILVKWRGDEETGRDQLDEILCEVIVISDSESDDEEDAEDGAEDGAEDDEETSASLSADESPVDRVMADQLPARATMPPTGTLSAQRANNSTRVEELPRASHAPQKVEKTSQKDKKAAKWGKRNFGRYRMVAEHQAARSIRHQVWDQALERQRQGHGGPMQSTGPAAMGRSSSHGPQFWGPGEHGRPSPALLTTGGSLEPPPHNAHRSYGAALPPVDESRGQRSRADELQQPMTRTFYGMPQLIPIQENPRSHGFRPIAEPRSAAHGGLEVERVRSQGQDLKDYLVPSIEPASPEPSAIPPRFPPPYRPSETGLYHDAERPVRMVTQPRGLTGVVGERFATQGQRAPYADEGFIRLPPRSEPGRTFIPVDQRPETVSMRNPQFASAARASGVTAPSGEPGLQYPSSRWMDEVSVRIGDPDIRPVTRPIWMGSDGTILRSESRPIVIHDYPPGPAPQPRTGPAYVLLETRRFSPERRADVRQPGQGWTDPGDRRHADAGIDHVVAMTGDFADIVQVSNKFPRQYEPRPVPAAADRYDLRQAAPQQGASQEPYNGNSQYTIPHNPDPRQRVERFVERAEAPRHPDGKATYAVYPPERHARQERRVVGIEYVNHRPSAEARVYSDRGLIFDMTNPAYRSRSQSVVPLPYPGFSYPQDGSPAPKRNEVILLD